MRTFAYLAALGSLLYAPDAQAGTGSENAKSETGENSVGAQQRITISELRNQVRLLTKENQETRAENERLRATVDAIPAAVRPQAGKLAEMIAERRKAGLSQVDAEECARRQLAHDEEIERQAEAAKPKATKAPKPEKDKEPAGDKKPEGGKQDGK